MTVPPSPDRRAIGVIGAYVEGWRRVLRAPAVWIGLTVVGLVSAFAPAVVVRARLEAYLISGDSIDFAAEGSRLFKTLTDVLPERVDPSTLVADSMATQPLDKTLAASIAWRLALVLFLSGGVLDRLARARPVGSAAFFAACGVYFWRFLRLAVPLGILYWIVDHFLAPYAAAEFAALVLLLMLADFAKVRAVVEDRRSMFGSLVASMRFVRRRPLPILGLVILNLGALAVVLALGQVETRIELGLARPAWLTSVQFLLGALLWQWARLASVASEVAYFQGQFAHAGYTAAPLPIWPDSPAAEAIENLAQQRGGRGGPGA